MCSKQAGLIWVCNALCLLPCALLGQCRQAAVPGRQWEEPATHTPRACFTEIALCDGRKSPDTGTGKVLASFSLVISACRYPFLHWNKEVSQTHTIRGNCVRLTLYPARSFQAWAVFISSSIENRRDVLIGGRMRLLRHFFPSLSTNQDSTSATWVNLSYSHSYLAARGFLLHLDFCYFHSVMSVLLHYWEWIVCGSLTFGQVSYLSLSTTRWILIRGNEYIKDNSLFYSSYPSPRHTAFFCSCCCCPFSLCVYALISADGAVPRRGAD